MLNSRSNLFTFNFPKTFVPDTLAEKYNKYLDRLPGTLITKPIDIINYGIQSISFPGISYEPTQVTNKIGGSRSYRDTLPQYSLISKFTVTFQLLDGYVNYWLLQDTFNYYYAVETGEQFLPEAFLIRITDAEGNVLTTTTFDNVLFTGLSDLELSFSNNAAEFTTFDAYFNFNSYDRKTELL